MRGVLGVCPEQLDEWQYHGLCGVGSYGGYGGKSRFGGRDNYELIWGMLTLQFLSKWRSWRSNRSMTQELRKGISTRDTNCCLSIFFSLLHMYFLYNVKLTEYKAWILSFWGQYVSPMLFDDEYTGATLIHSAVFGKSQMYIAKRSQRKHTNTSWGLIWFMISLRCKTNLSYCFHNDLRQRGQHILCNLLMEVECMRVGREVKLEPNFGSGENLNRQ